MERRITVGEIIETEAANACFRDYGVRVNIPHPFLWGRQTTDEYSGRKLRRVRASLREQGRGFLEKYPIAAVYVSPSELPFISIYDGHHRARMAPAFGIREIPAWIVHIDQLAQALKRDPLDLGKTFKVQVSAAYADFWGRRKDLPKPRFVDSRIRTPDDLARYFQDEAHFSSPNPRTLVYQAEFDGK